MRMWIMAVLAGVLMSSGFGCAHRVEVVSADERPLSIVVDINVRMVGSAPVVACDFGEKGIPRQ